MVEMLEQKSESTSDLPEGFKMTELGLLPEEWKLVRLGELVEKGKVWIQNGYANGSHNQNGDGIPHLRPFNISMDGTLILNQVKYVPAPPHDSPYWLKQGDVIFNNTNSEELVGKTTYFSLDGDYVLSNHMTIIRVLDSNNLDPYWLAKKMHHLWELGFFRSICRRHVNQASISLERLKQVVIPLPPLHEQRAIARVLRTVQRAKEATEQVIQATRELKKSLMRHLFTYGPVPIEEAERVPLKETEIGLVPKHWEVVRLEEVTQKTKQIDPRKKPDWQFKYVDVSSISNQLLRIINYSVYKGTKAPSRARKLMKAGDILFATVRPSLKRIALVPLDLDGQICSTAFCIVRPNPQLADNFYVFFAISNDDFVCRVSTHQRGSSYPAITDKDVLNEFIPLPPLSEQREIARILDKVDKKLQAEEARKQALDVLFKSLLHNLMTGKIRVKDLALPVTGEVR